MKEEVRMPLRVMLVDEQPERADLLDGALRQAGHVVVGRLGRDGDLRAAIGRLSPDVVIIDMDSPDRDALENMHCINRECPRPIVMFTHDGDAETIRSAVRAGVSAYVVDGLEPHRVAPILDAAIARFEAFQTVRKELEEAKASLADRKFIEKAKGILMRQSGMDEETAYRSLRRMAMDRNLRLPDLARSLIAAAELLG